MKRFRPTRAGSAAGPALALGSLLLCLSLALTGLPAQAQPPENLHLSSGQVVYVPAYTHVYYTDKGKVFPLTTTLIIHNTDPQERIEITSARFHDAGGMLIREYADKPMNLGPFAAVDILVRDAGQAKGLGTCFVVTWRAGKPVSPPIIECVIIGATGQQGISFRTQGKVVRELP